MPQFDPNVFATQLFWLLVTFSALFFGLRKWVLPRVSDVLEARQKRIDDDLGKAATLKQEAEEVLAAYDKARAEAEARAQTLIREAQEAAAAAAAKQHEALGSKLAAQVSEAEANILKARKEAEASIGSLAGEVVAAATERLIGVKISSQDAEAAIKASVQERA